MLSFFSLSALIDPLLTALKTRNKSGFHAFFLQKTFSSLFFIACFSQ